MSSGSAPTVKLNGRWLLDPPRQALVQPQADLATAVHRDRTGLLRHRRAATTEVQPPAAAEALADVSGALLRGYAEAGSVDHVLAYLRAELIGEDA